jgi:regulatory GntR family protein
MCYDIAVTHPSQELRPNVPLHIQIADIYKQRIASGELRAGDRLPTVRQMQELHHVAGGTAARAIELLADDRLVETRGRAGTVVTARLVLGPQQFLTLAPAVPGQRTEVRSAGMVRLPHDGPDRIVPVLGLERVPRYDWWNVYRREQVTRWPGGPRLEVSWFDPSWADRIPALADPAAPVTPLGGVAALIAAETGDPVASGWHGVEARPALDDGREVPLFGPVVVLAAVYWWVSASGATTEYGEYCLPQHRVIEHHYGVERTG